MYRGELENLALPLEEKAIEALEKALAKAYELSIYNEWTLLAQDKINKLPPGRLRQGARGALPRQRVLRHRRRRQGVPRRRPDRGPGSARPAAAQARAPAPGARGRRPPNPRPSEARSERPFP